MAEEPSTPPPKKGRRRRVADLSGLASAWEADKDVRKGARKRKEFASVEGSYQGWSHRLQQHKGQLEGDSAFDQHLLPRLAAVQDSPS